MRPLAALFAAAAIALPWYWAVALATEGEFLRGFFLEHNLGRAMGTMEGHGGSILFYPAAILVGFFPWSVFLVPLVIDLVLQLRRRDGRNPSFVLAACWVGVYLAIFSLARTKLPSYITPCYPALALLAGSYVDRWSRDASVVAGRWLLVALGSLSVAGAAIAIAVPVAAQRYLPGEEWLGLVGMLPLAGGAICIGLTVVRSHRAAASIFGATAVAFVSLVFAVVVQQADRHQTNHLILAAIYAHADDPKIASYKALEPSWVYYGERPILELPRAYRTNRPPPDQVSAFFAREPQGFVITTKERLGELDGWLAPDVVILAETHLFLKDEQLVLLGRPRPGIGIAASSEKAIHPTEGLR